jgi:hypothetical protein
VNTCITWHSGYLYAIWPVKIPSYVPLPGINQDFLAVNEKYFNKALPMISDCFYFRFTKHFVGITHKLHKLNKYIYTLEWVLLIYALRDISLAFSDASLQLREYGFQTIASILFFLHHLLCNVFFFTLATNSVALQFLEDQS